MHCAGVSDGLAGDRYNVHCAAHRSRLKEQRDAEVSQHLGQETGNVSQATLQVTPWFSPANLD